MNVETFIAVFYNTLKISDDIQKNISKKPLDPNYRNMVVLKNKISEQHKLIPKRFKRGLFNFVGQIDKSLFGVATEEDITHLETKVQTLLSNEKTLAIELNLRTSLFSSFINKTTELINKIIKKSEALEGQVKLLKFQDDTTMGLKIVNNQLELILYYFPQIVQTLPGLRSSMISSFFSFSAILIHWGILKSQG